MKTRDMITAVVLVAVLILSDLGAALAAQPGPALSSTGASEGTALAARASGSYAQAAVLPGLRVVESAGDHVILELSTPTYQVEQSTADDGPCDLLLVPDYGSTEAAGWPRLPVAGATVGIPPQGHPALTVLETEVSVVAAPLHLCPVPRHIFDIDAGGHITHTGEAAIRDATAYATAGFYPATEAELAATGFARSQRVAQVRFHPFQYNPLSGELRHNRRILVRLDFVPAGHAPIQPAKAEKDKQGHGRGGRFGQPPANGRDKPHAKRWFTPETADLTIVGTTAEADPFGATAAPTVVNADEASSWLVQPVLASPPPGVPGPAGPWFKVLVKEDGIHQVTHADLLAAGIDLPSVDARTFHLYNEGQEVAIYVVGEEDGTFDAGDVILFYGQKMSSRYTDINVYWLSWGGSAGRRMAVASGSPGGPAQALAYRTTLRLEQDLLYQSNLPSGADADRWYWNYLYANGTPASQSYSFSLRNLDAGSSGAKLRALLKGYSASPRHHTRIYLNGHLVEDATWYPQNDHLLNADIPSSYLVEGPNTLTVEALLDGGIASQLLFVNWFEIDYQRRYVAEEDELFFDGDQAGSRIYQVDGFSTEAIEVFDVTSPEQPLRIADAVVTAADGGYRLTFAHAASEEPYFIALTPARRRRPLGIVADRPSSLRSTANGADYILITHGDFYDAAQALAAHRAAQGLRTAVVDVQDIYDEFSYGILEPEAIRDFLAYAYSSWTRPAPAYVLLLGDGHYDFLNNLGTGEPNFIPPYLAAVDYWIGEVAADNRYVCVAGDDVFPDMHLGRLPVRTAAEASAVVSKIINYERHPEPGDWNRQVLFVTDNPDSAGNFYGYSDAIADRYLPAPYSGQKVYYGLTHSPSSVARSAILQALNAGRLIVNYVGHGGTQVWASEGLFRASDARTLTNGGRLPLMVPMACYDGYYYAPSPVGRDYSCTAESVVRAPQGGAIASWSATGMGLAYTHDFLNKGLFQAIFFEGVAELGPATTQGKLYLYSRYASGKDQIDEYTLFGDPALRLNVLRPDLQIVQTADPAGELQAGQTITYRLSYTNEGPVAAPRVVITDRLPESLLRVSVTSAGSALSPRPGSRFTWDVGTLAAGQGGVITITAVVSPWFSGMLTNTAEIATTAPESDLADNVSYVSTTVTAADMASILVEAGADQTVNEGEAVQFAGTFSAPPPLDGYSVTWDFGDGSTADGDLNPSHVYADDGVYEVRLSVADGRGAVGSDTLTVVVHNVAPQVGVVAAPVPACPRQEIVFQASVADPGALDTHTFDWDWGDGTTASGSAQASHAYALGGIYTVTLTVRDDDGGQGQAVVAAAVRCELYPIALYAGAVAGLPVGTELTNVLNGSGPGNFGWLSWTGDQGVPRLATSLTGYGDSHTYSNPLDADDHVLSAGDWVYGVPGISNASSVRSALDALQSTVITVPLWDQASGQGSSLRYHVVGFARVRLTAYSLSGQNRISVLFLGLATCPGW